MQCPTSIEHCCGFSPLLNSKGCRAFGLVLSLLAPGCQLQYSLLLTESKTTLHPNCSTAVDCRVFKRSKDFECFLRWGKDLANHASILLGAHQRVRALQSSTCQDLPRLPKTCLVSIPSVGIYRHLSAAVIQDLGGNVLYLARLSARCNGSWTWALSSGPEIWGSISSVMRCYEMFLEYITKGSVSYLSSPCFSTSLGGIGGPAHGIQGILAVMYWISIIRGGGPPPPENGHGFNSHGWRGHGPPH